MADSILSVCWKDYTSELATVYKSLFEKNFLVDCTISAEGQCLKVHRLVLSACSPYFHKLFAEDTEKHPLIIISGESFTTLKTVIDFVYRGETHVTERNLKAFLNLAQSLQIKGLNAFTKDYKNQSKSPSRNISCGLAEDNQNTCEVESINTSDKDSPENYSLRPPLLDGYPDTAHTNSSIPFEGCSTTCEEASSASANAPFLEQRSLGCDEVSVDTDTTVKHEVFYPGFLETGHNNCPNTFTKCYKDKNVSSNTTRSIPHGTFKGNQDTYEVQNINASHNPENYFQQHPPNLDGYPGDGESLHSNGNSALVILEQQQLQQQLQEQQFQQQQEQNIEQQLGQQQQLQQTDEQQQQQLQQTDDQQQRDSHSACELSSLPGLTEQNNQSLPELLMPLSDEADASESEESTNALDVPGNETEEMAEETELTHDKSLNPSSGAEGSPTPQDEDQEQDKGQTMPEGSANSVPRPTVPSAPELQAHVRLIRMPTLKCRDCDAIFASSRALEDHKRQHSGPQPLRRGVGGASSTATSDLTPPTRRRAAERQCSKALALHKQRHKVERPHPCDVCGKAFTTAAAVALHQRRHKRERERTHPRDVSGKALVKAATHALQKRRHTRKGPLSCSLCGKVFTVQSYLILHTRIHTGERPYLCSVCGKAFSQSSDLSKHKRTHTGERPFSCVVCGKSFSRSSALAVHKRTHTGERSYSCDVCGKAFRHSANLAVHKRTHTGERPHVCSVCGKAFSKSSSLAVHKRSHTGERSYSCDVCGKAFSQASNLATHKRTHTGERSYSCDVCGKAFSLSGNLTVHKRTHTGERPYLCSVCGKAFSQSSSLAVHKRSHTGERSYSCVVCGKAFSQSSNLAVHKRTHTGERSYSCDVCGKTFNQSSNLAVHKRTHTGERPYSCDVCGKTFNRSSALNRHKARHTGERTYSCDAYSLCFSRKSSMITHWQRTHVTK